MTDKIGTLGKDVPTSQAPGKAFMDAHKRERYTSGQRALTQEQVQKFLLHITDLIHLGLFQLSIATGARREDVVRIKVSDVDFDNQAVSYYESKKGRTKKVFIPLSVANTLKMIVTINKKETFLFPGNSHKVRGHGHLSGRNAYNLFQSYLRKAEIPSRPFHTLRATFIKLAQKKGWSAEQTAEHVGDTIAVIQEHYATPSDEEMRETVNTKPIL